MLCTSNVEIHRHPALDRNNIYWLDYALHLAFDQHRRKSLSICSFSSRRVDSQFFLAESGRRLPTFRNAPGPCERQRKR